MPWPDGTNEHNRFVTMSRMAEISPVHLALARTEEALELMSPKLDNLGTDDVRGAGPWDRHQSPEPRAFETIGYIAATYSNELTFPSFVEYLGRIEAASKIMADVYASNRNAPLSQLLPVGKLMKIARLGRNHRSMKCRITVPNPVTSTV